MTASAEVLDELRRSSLPIEAQACLAALAEGEGGTSFRILYGGSLWTGSMAAFPDWQGAIGPTGKPTHAAGAWQDQPQTYADVAKITGVTSFEPAAQIANNAALAQHDFQARTNADLLESLRLGRLDLVQSGLVGTWPGGADVGFAARYNDNLTVLAAAPEPHPAPAPAQSDVVIDLSHWDDPVDFAAVKAAGIEAVILKCTQGTSFVDPTYAARSVAAAAAGLLVGAYHFFTTADGKTQIDWFLLHVGLVTIFALDFEPDPTSPALAAAASAMVADLHARNGRWPLLYTGRWVVPMSDPTLSQCPLWLAEWGTNPVPPPGWSTWTLWQYTATGTVPGVAGPCDRSRFAGTVAELHDWWRGGAPSADTLQVLVTDLQAQLATATDTAAKIATAIS